MLISGQIRLELNGLPAAEKSSTMMADNVHILGVPFRCLYFAQVVAFLLAFLQRSDTL